MTGRLQYYPSACRVTGIIPSPICPSTTLSLSTYLWYEKWEVDSPTLPLTLEDGKMAIFYLSDVVTGEISVPNQYLGVNVFDAEGNVYSKYSEGVYNPKYHYRIGKMKPPSIFRRLSSRFYFWRQERKLKKELDKGSG